MDEIEALSILSAIPHLGAVKIKLLVQNYGFAQEALLRPVSEIAELPGFGPKILQYWGDWKKNSQWQEDYYLAKDQDIQIIPYTSKEYPARLKEISDHPVLLYVKGKLIPADASCIAVVGTRQASHYGMEAAALLSEQLTRRGFTVVSGLARGIDTSAHLGALQQGRTLAVIGSGLLDIYPRENLSLAQQISQKGALMSEFSPRTPPDRLQFPQRNRIVSGMTLGTVLIESPIKGGAMITLEKARSQGRPCFALPGRIGENFKGNHCLIKNGWAKLIEDVDDITAVFEDFFESSLIKPAKTFHQKLELESEELQLLELLPLDEVSIEEMLAITKLPVMKLNVLLMSLILKKVIKEYPGKIYRKQEGWHA